MNSISSRDEGFEVLDSTDWLATPLPKLSTVEAALRCQVCKDFYTSPMITSCCHTFCSLCIRRALSENGRCPFCRAPDQEIKLRLNNSVYDMVEAFKAARSEILECASSKPVAREEAASPKRRREQSDVASVGDGPSTKRTRSSRRLAEATEPVEVLDSDEEDTDFTPDDGIIQCPICQKKVRHDTINAHIDRGCVDEAPKPRSAKSGVSNSFTGLSSKEVKKPERLAQPNYSMLKDAPLRKKLLEQGLSTGGSRQILERRYAEWVTLWNANCDARIPKAKHELKRELEIWERTQGSRAQASGSSNPGGQIKEKDFDGKAWASKHEDSFRDLIANARRKLPTKQSSPADTPKSGGTENGGNAPPIPPTLDSSESLEPERVDDKVAINAQYLQSYNNPSVLPYPKHNTQNLTDPQLHMEQLRQNHATSTSSQISNGIPILEKDPAGIGSDMSTIETI